MGSDLPAVLCARYSGVAMTDPDYTHCPLGPEKGCELHEYRTATGEPMGFRYGCPGSKAGKHRDTGGGHVIRYFLR